jgi:8-oxo-dGTP pyrophosphatase MutT (NUDIX family)
MISKQVEFEEGSQSEEYHSLGQADYVAILAKTPDGRIPLVRQYRPAVESFTWELPSGLVEMGEDPEATCSRELQEETGLLSSRVVKLGSFYPDTGRLSNLLHAFYVTALDPAQTFVPERGMAVDFVTIQELRTRALAGEFRHQLHLGVIAMAAFKGFLPELS